MDTISPGSLWTIIRRSFSHWTSHNASRLGAALSYYTVFSIAPLLFIVSSIAGLLLSPVAVQNVLTGEIAALIGSDGAAFIQSLLVEAHKPAAGITATVVGFIFLIIGASGVLSELKSSLDDFWDTKESDKPARSRGFMGFVRTRILTLSLIPVLVFLLLVSLAASAFLGAAGSRFGLLSGPTLLLDCFNAFYTFLIVGLLFTFIYRFLPEKHLPWKDTLLGGAFTAALFMIGKALIGVYLSTIAGTSAFGAAGALIIVLVWVYYSIQIFFLGAAITYVYSSMHGQLRKKKV